MENNFLVQLGGILLTLVVTLIGIFKGLIPQLLGSFEKRLADKDIVLTQQKQALDETCRERREQTEKFLESLNNVVMNNSTAMTSLTGAMENLQKKMSDDHAVHHENHRDILSLLQQEKKSKARVAGSRKA